MQDVVKVFNEAEQLECREELVYLFHIYKAIIGLNNTQIIECLLSDNSYLNTFGILECTYPLNKQIDDPDINISKAKYKYRRFLKDRVMFVNTANIQDSDILSRIHLNFHLIFLKDTATARWIEEGTYEMLMGVSYNR